VGSLTRPLFVRALGVTFAGHGVFAVEGPARFTTRVSDIDHHGSQLRDEIAVSKHIIEDKLGRTCESFAWPFGTMANIGPAGPNPKTYPARALLRRRDCVDVEHHADLPAKQIPAGSRPAHDPPFLHTGRDMR
jgi:hypothetical protein